MSKVKREHVFITSDDEMFTGKNASDEASARQSTLNIEADKQITASHKIVLLQSYKTSDGVTFSGKDAYTRACKRQTAINLRTHKQAIGVYAYRTSDGMCFGGKNANKMADNHQKDIDT